MSRVTTLDKESVRLIATTRAKALELAQTAQAALKDARIAELEFKNTIQQVFLENGLDSTCNVNLDTGNVIWKDEETSSEIETQKETAAE